MQTFGGSAFEEGWFEGQLLGFRNGLLRVLTLRFPTLPDEIVQRINQVTDIERLKKAIDQVLLVNNPEELGL